MSAVSTAVDQIASALKSRGYESEQDLDNRKATVLRYLAPLSMLEVERDAFVKVAQEQALEIARLRAELTIATGITADPLERLDLLASSLERLIGDTFNRIEALPAGTLPVITDQRAGLTEEQFFERYVSIHPVKSARAGWHEATCRADHGPGGSDWITTGLESVVEAAAYEHIGNAHPLGGL